jgi:hypothetical protein
MANSPDSLPLAEQPPDDQALLARAFWLLLDHGRPLEVGVLADALQREPAAVAAAVDRLEQAGLTRRDPAGRLLGSHGLSVAPTHHELVIDGRRRWTWCAYDAVGILGALEADGQVHSRSPHSGTLIELTFDAGQPAATDAGVRRLGSLHAPTAATMLVLVHHAAGRHWRTTGSPGHGTPAQRPSSAEHRRPGTTAAWLSQQESRGFKSRWVTVCDVSGHRAQRSWDIVPRSGLRLGW